MEFYELLEKIIDAAPAGYENIVALLRSALPWVMEICALATCFFGHKVHKIWNAFFFFWIGFLVPVFVIGLLTSPKGTGMDILILFGVVTGGLCAYFSKKLFKLQLFVTTFFLVFAALPTYLSFLGDAVSTLIGFVGGIVVGIISTKYKYIMTIVTTAFTGASLFFVPIQAKTLLSDGWVVVFSLLLGAAGLAAQIYTERKELKESGEGLVKGWKKIRKTLDPANRKGNRKLPADRGGAIADARQNRVAEPTDAVPAGNEPHREMP